jgi:hypothetical protein
MMDAMFSMTWCMMCSCVLSVLTRAPQLMAVVSSFNVRPCILSRVFDAMVYRVCCATTVCVCC